MATTITPQSAIRAFQVSYLDTFNRTVDTAGTHSVAVKLSDVTTLSGITITIEQNATTITTVGPGVASNNELNALALINCALNDVISVIITSSTASDTGPNQIKGYIAITRITAG